MIYKCFVFQLLLPGCIKPQQSTYSGNPCFCKRNALLFHFSGFFYFQGNSLNKVKRTFWTLVLYFFDQSFIMTIIQVIVAPFVIKCIAKPIEYTWCLLKAPKNRLTHITNTLKKPNAKQIFNLFKLVITVYTNVQVTESFSNSVIIVALQIFNFGYNFSS